MGDGRAGCERDQGRLAVGERAAAADGHAGRIAGRRQRPIHGDRYRALGGVPAQGGRGAGDACGGHARQVQVRGRGLGVHVNALFQDRGVRRDLVVGQAGQTGYAVHRLDAHRVATRRVLADERVVHGPRAPRQRRHERPDSGHAARFGQQRDLDAVGRHAAAGVAVGQQGIVGHAGQVDQPGVRAGRMGGGVHAGAGEGVQPQDRRRAVHVDGGRGGRLSHVANVIGRLGLEGVAPLARGRESGAPDPVPDGVLAAGRGRPGRRGAIPCALAEANIHAGDARSRVAGRGEHLHRRGGQVSGVRLDLRGGVVGVHGQVLALALLHPARLVEVQVAHLAGGQPPGVDRHLVHAAVEGVSPVGVAG